MPQELRGRLGSTIDSCLARPRQRQRADRPVRQSLRNVLAVGDPRDDAALDAGQACDLRVVRPVAGGQEVDHAREVPLYQAAAVDG